MINGIIKTSNSGPANILNVWPKKLTSEICVFLCDYINLTINIFISNNSGYYPTMFILIMNFI